MGQMYKLQLVEVTLVTTVKLRCSSLVEAKRVSLGIMLELSGLFWVSGWWG